MSRQAWIENAKVTCHPKWLRRVRKDPFTVMPIYLEASPAGRCNHRCTFCAPEMLGYPDRYLEPSAWGSLLAELKALREDDPDQLGVKSIQYAGEGEPTLHKDLAKIIKATDAAGMDVGMLTNATGLTEKLTREIFPFFKPGGYVQASVNAGTAQTYAKIHRIDVRHWDLVWRNLERAVKVRGEFDSKVDIGVNMTVLTQESVEKNGSVIPANWREIEKLARMASASGVDYVSFKPYSQHPYSKETAKHYGNMTYREVMEELFAVGDELINRYSSDGFEVVFRFTRFEEYEASNRGYQFCRATPTIWSYIQSDGLWLSCSAYWTDPRFALGNILSQKFREIWFSDRRRQHLEFVWHRLDISECRKTCHPDKENKYINWFLSLSDEEAEVELARLETLPLPDRANFI